MIRNLIHRKYYLKCIVDKYHIEVGNFKFQCFQHFLPFLLADEMEVLAPCSPNPLLCILMTTAKPRLHCVRMASRASSKSSEENPSLSFLALVGGRNPWHSLACGSIHGSLPPSSHGQLPCMSVCVHLPSCYKDTSHWISSTLVQCDLFLIWLHLHRLLRNEISFTGSRWTYVLGDMIQASTARPQPYASSLIPSGNRGFSYASPLWLLWSQQYPSEQPIALREIPGEWKGPSAPCDIIHIISLGKMSQL